VPPKDSDALAAAIAQLLDQPERRCAMGRAGRERVLQHFTWRRAAERTVDVYREVISERAYRARVAERMRMGAEAC
jgi:glycosyltransferase involved in cell wall biosynthesis